jgi:HlyD family secretion protein
VRFSALDQRTTPELFGTVAVVSADAFTDNATSASYYRVEIRLNEGELGRLPAGTTLIPGMPVEAFIRTADRTPINYLTRPLMDYIARTFRDG